MWTRWVFISVSQGNSSNTEERFLSTSFCTNSNMSHLNYLTAPAWHKTTRNWLINVPFQHTFFPKAFKKLMNISLSSSVPVRWHHYPSNQLLLTRFVSLSYLHQTGNFPSMITSVNSYTLTSDRN